MPSPENISSKANRVRLADLYQHIGKTEYRNWVDNEIGIFLKTKIKIADFSSNIQAPQRRIIEPQYSALFNTNSIKIRDADFEEQKRHLSILDVIEKNLGEITLYITRNTVSKSLAEIKAMDFKELKFNFVLSKITVKLRNGEKEIYNVMVDGNSLKNTLLIIKSNRSWRGRTHSGAGRRINAESPSINAAIKKVIANNPDIKSPKKIAVIAEREKLPSTKKDGGSLTVDAIEKRIIRSKLLS